MSNQTHCGYVGIVGRPNVGKSSLLNALLAEKLCIISPKAQTTRHKILGIKTEENKQLIYADTPGMHENSLRELNKAMNKAALSVLGDVDVLFFVIAGDVWTDEDTWVLDRLKAVKTPVILVLNKIDLIKGQDNLLPLIEQLKTKMDFAAIVPVSALKGRNLPELEKLAMSYLPEGPHLFPEGQRTDRNERFFVAEIIREKILQLTDQEVPHASGVTIDKMKKEKKILHIHAIIWVERSGQKAIVIGKGGEKLKQIGERARKNLEKHFEQKIFLQLWVKVKDKWADKTSALRELGL